MHREALLLDDAEQLATLAAPRSGAGCAAPSRRQLTLLGVLAALAAIGLTVNSITQRRNRANVRGPFGARKRANLIFEQDFRTAHTLDPEVWNVARTLSDDPHQSFQYYTDDSSVLYVNNTDGTLRIVPGLFSTMGPLETVAGHPPFLAEDVMRGSCSPYPACATFKVPGCTDDPATGGCEATGGAWSSLGPTVVKPTTSAKLDTKGKFEFTVCARALSTLRMGDGSLLCVRGNVKGFDCFLVIQSVGGDAVSGSVLACSREHGPQWRWIVLCACSRRLRSAATLFSHASPAIRPQPLPHSPPQYGRLEIRLRLPAGDWLWPSFWLLPATNAYGAAWPLSGARCAPEARAAVARGHRIFPLSFFFVFLMLYFGNPSSFARHAARGAVPWRPALLHAPAYPSAAARRARPPPRARRAGQIDLVESRGNGPAFALNGQPAGRDVATSTFHYGENWYAFGGVAAGAWSPGSFPRARPVSAGCAALSRACGGEGGGVVARRGA